LGVESRPTEAGQHKSPSRQVAARGALLVASLAGPACSGGCFGYGVQSEWFGQMPPVVALYCQPVVPSPAAPVPATTVSRSLNGLAGSSASTYGPYG